MEPHPDFAIPISARLFLHTNVVHPDAGSHVEGQAIALGWYRDAAPDADPVGTLYLVADPVGARPLWIRQSAVTSFSLMN